MKLKISISTENDEFTGEESVAVNEIKNELIDCFTFTGWKVTKLEPTVNCIELQLETFS